MRSISSAMAWETARRSSTELRSKFGSSSWNFSPASCTCIVSVQFWPSQRLVLITVRPWGSELMTFSKDEDTKVSRGRKRGRLGPFCRAPCSPQRRAAAQEEIRQEHEGRTHQATFHARHRQPSGVAPLVSLSEQPTHRLAGPPIQCIGEVCRLPLKLFLFNRTSTRRGSISQDIARPATITTRHAAREKLRLAYLQASRPIATSRHFV